MGWLFLGVMLGGSALILALGMMSVVGMPGLGAGWDFAMFSGFLVMAILLQMFVLTARPLPWPRYDGRFFMWLHIGLGWLAVVFLALHIGGALMVEPLVWKDIWPPILRSMQAGVVGCMVVVFLMLTSGKRMRGKIFGAISTFRLWHHGLAMIVLFAAGLHGWWSGYRLGAPCFAALVGCGIVVVAAFPSFRRWEATRRHSAVTVVRRLRGLNWTIFPMMLGIFAGSLGVMLAYVVWLNG